MATNRNYFEGGLNCADPWNHQALGNGTGFSGPFVVPPPQHNQSHLVLPLSPYEQWQQHQTAQFPNFNFPPPPPLTVPLYPPSGPPPNFSYGNHNTPNFTMQPYSDCGASTSGGLSTVNTVRDKGTDNGTDYKSEREKDQDWLNAFMTPRCSRATPRPEPPDASQLKISESQQLFGKCLVFIDALKELHDKLRSEFDADESSWQRMARDAATVKSQLEHVMNQLTPKNIENLKEKLKIRTKKRICQQKQRERKLARKLDQQKKTERLHDKINSWQESIKLEQLAASMEKKMKAEADSVLMEVRRKRSEATKMLDLVRAVVKLRTIKHQSKSKDAHVPSSCDETFATVSREMEKVLTERLSDYAEEERALQVMLDEEQQGTRESVHNKREQERRHKMERRREEIRGYLFGQEVMWDSDPLYPYYEYYTRADRDLETLTRVRRSWDRWLLPAESRLGSGVPVSWVIPERPTSEAWALHMDTA